MIILHTKDGKRISISGMQRQNMNITQTDDMFIQGSYAIGNLPPRYRTPALVYKLQPMKRGIGLIIRQADGWYWVEGCVSC